MHVRALYMLFDGNTSPRREHELQRHDRAISRFCYHSLGGSILQREGAVFRKPRHIAFLASRESNNSLSLYPSHFLVIHTSIQDFFFIETSTAG